MKRQIGASQTAVQDFDPMCDCGNHAVAYLEIHAVDYCTPDTPTWGKLLCKPCLTRDLQRVQDILLDERPTVCSICGVTMVAMSDMVVRVCPLWAT